MTYPGQYCNEYKCRGQTVCLGNTQVKSVVSGKEGKQQNGKDTAKANCECCAESQATFLAPFNSLAYNMMYSPCPSLPCPRQFSHRSGWAGQQRKVGSRLPFHRWGLPEPTNPPPCCSPAHMKYMLQVQTTAQRAPGLQSPNQLQPIRMKQSTFHVKNNNSGYYDMTTEKRQVDSTQKPSTINNSICSLRYQGQSKEANCNHLNAKSDSFVHSKREHSTTRWSDRKACEGGGN